MAVARRQRKKPTKMEQKKIQRWEWEPQEKQTALLASPVYVGQAQGEEEKHIKRGAKIELLTSLHFFGVSPPSCLKDVFSFACQIKLSCNTGLSHHFKFLLQWDKTEEITNSPDNSNFERSPTVGKMLPNITACGREIIHEKKSQSIQHISLLSYTKKLPQPPQPSATTTLMSQQPPTLM